ncbi:MAG: hypothetical protein U0350_26720 [Caldilineaceae bacterium]
MNEYQAARSTIFRAMLGEEPRPTAEEVKQARALLQDNPAFRTGLDELVNVVVLEKASTPTAGRDQLQAYVAAQLAGETFSTEFDQLRQQLDASVELSEEYALLYETMEREQAGTLPVPLDLPPLNLDRLLVVPKTQKSATPALRWPKFPALAWPSFFRLPPLLRPIVILLIVTTLGIGVWEVQRPLKFVSVDSANDSVKHSNTSFRSQMEFETPSPTFSTEQTNPPPEELNACLQLRRTSFAGNLCKI